jgi:hypothetical protein
MSLHGPDVCLDFPHHKVSSEAQNNAQTPAKKGKKKKKKKRREENTRRDEPM